MYFYQIFPMIFLLISWKSIIFAVYKKHYKTKIKYIPLWIIQQKKNSPWRIVPTSTTPPHSRNSTSGSAPTPNSRHVSPPRVTFPHNAVLHHSRCDFSITTSVSRFSSRRQWLKTPILHFYILHFYRDKVFCSDL